MQSVQPAHGAVRHAIVPENELQIYPDRLHSKGHCTMLMKSDSTLSQQTNNRLRALLLSGLQMICARLITARVEVH